MTANNPEGARVLLIDDHPAVRQGVALLLAIGRHVVGGEAQNRGEALALLAHDRIDLALLDLSLGEESGLELIADLDKYGVPALVYSMHEDPESVERAFHHGARGYVTKREEPAVLLEAVGVVMAGKRFVSPRAAQSLAERLLVPEGAGAGVALSDREQQILALMGQGDTSAEIADVLAISARTVETYCGRMLEKLELSGMKALRKYAISTHREK